jgi:Rrf2 family transcriptional regulator, nitric oxide-sensitive transcriptional repressor
MFSQTTEYALRVIAYVAGLEGEPATTKQIAAATQVPEGYLAKVVRSLNREGLLNSQRGLHGGSVLARPAAQITVYDVINAIDPLPRITTCPLGLKSHGSRLCPLHRKLDDAIGMVEGAFRSSSIADLLSEDTGSKPMCDEPRGKPAASGQNGKRKVTLNVTKGR